MCINFPAAWQTMHDEYWHEHIDANQYPGFEYTALVYLNKQGVKPVRSSPLPHIYK